MSLTNSDAAGSNGIVNGRWIVDGFEVFRTDGRSAFPDLHGLHGCFICRVVADHRVARYFIGVAQSRRTDSVGLKAQGLGWVVQT